MRYSIVSFWAYSFFALWLSLTFLVCARASAQDVAVDREVITVGALLPVLAQTALGEIVVTDAPVPGQSKMVRATQVKAALKAEGHSAEGLSIPRSVRVVRKTRALPKSELEGRVKDALSAQLAPCDVSSMSSLPALTLGDGDYEIEAEAKGRRDSGRMAVMVNVKQGERAQRVSVQIELSCPAPVINPGANIRILAVRGPVRVSAPAVANQSGRVGDEIRVTNQITRKGMRGRVLDAETVEVIQ